MSPLSRRCSAASSFFSISFGFARLVGLFRDEDGRPKADDSLQVVSSHVLDALLARFIPTSSYCVATRVRRACMSPAVSSSHSSSYGPKISRRWTRLRHRPPYELRAYVNQYICKLFFCAFFCGATRIFYYYYFFLYLYPRLLLS